MASSIKRTSSTSEDQKGAVAKKRRRKPSISEEEDTRGSSSLPKYLAEPPMSKIYNSSFRNNKPAELFRKDLISAMKLPDNEQLSLEDYWLLADSWKQEWERGVQVPVNPEALPEPNVRILKSQESQCVPSLCHDALPGVIRKKDKSADFKLPKKFIRCSHDEYFSNDLHALVHVAAQAEKMCRYDLDDMDVQWLKLLNEEREDMGLPIVEESVMEKVMEELETQCFENLQEAIKNEKGIGIEYDEDVICDVCRSPDSEEGNEMVFCDSCNICVHQACYGITTIPEGSWVCCTCAFGIKPSCILCPNKGGAMKSTRSGQKWAHVSCALWIPEVSIGCVEKMEPITKISQIPASRWALVCCVCRERVGACIQCSVKTCKIAYHVTCAFKDGLAMKAIIDEENHEDGVKLRSYCEKHSKKRQGDESSDSESGEGQRKKKEKSKKKLEISSENSSIRKKRGDKIGSSQTSISQARIAEMEASFYDYASVKEAAEVLQVDAQVVDFIFQYWKLKRLANFNKPLITPKAEESVALGKQQEDSLYARMKMFVHLRQDLERVRNLCYMVSRREKLSRSWYRVKEEIFQKQVEVITDMNQTLSEKELEAVIHANHGDSVYDQLFSWNTDITPSLTSLVSILDGSNISVDLQAGANRLSRRQEKQQQTPQKLPNPYAKHYLNGMLSRSQRRISSLLPVSRDSSGGDNSVKVTNSDSLNDSSNSEQSSITKAVSKEGGSVLSETCSTPEVKREVVDKKDLPKPQMNGDKADNTNAKCDETHKESTKSDTTEKTISSPKTKSEKLSDKVKIKEESQDSTSSGECKNVKDDAVSSETFTGVDVKISKIEKESVESTETAIVVHSKDSNGETTEPDKNSESAMNVKPAAMPTSPISKSAQAEEIKEVVVEPTETVIQSTPTTRLRSGKDATKVLGADTKKNGQTILEKTNNQRRRPAFNLRRTSMLAKEANTKEQRTIVNKSARKDISPVKEKQREEDEKLRECLFSTSGSPRGSLSGYRIPKKARTDGAAGDCPEKKGGLTPLHEVSQPTVEYPENSYTRSRCAKGWNRDTEQSAYAVNGENQDQSTRLVIKLRKVPNYSTSQQWQRESDFPETPNTFKVVQNDWNAQTKKSERILRSDRRFLPPPDQQSQPLLPDPQTKENGSRYSRRFRGIAQKLSKSDIAYS